MKRYALVVMTLISLLTSGCGLLRSVEPVATSEPGVGAGGRRPVGDSESLLAYFENVRKLQASELAREHNLVRELYAASQSEVNRVRYAMLLSIPGTAFNDNARALEALEPLLKNQDAALHHLAFVVNAHIFEQRRGQMLQQKLDPEQRRAQDLQQKLDQELRRGQDRQQKLDALKSLEKDLINRDSGGGSRK